MTFYWLVGNLLMAFLSLPTEVLIALIVIYIFASLIFGRKVIAALISVPLMAFGLYLLLALFMEIEYRPIWIVTRVVAVAIDISIIGGIIALIRSKL